jgi:glucose uptake protein
MILPHSYPALLALMIFSMLAWGSWANTYKLAGKWRFELFYFDYALGLLLAALALALTFGSLGINLGSGPDGFSFWDDLMHADKHHWLYAFMGGVVFNFANMLLLAAVSVAGMAVAFPIGMGLALIVGVGLNYLSKSGAGQPAFLLGGCALVAAAIVVDVIAYRALGMLRHEVAARAGVARSTRRRAPIKGVVLALAGGLLMGTFLPLVEMGREGDAGLGPYAVCVLFAGGVFVSTFVFNMFFMNLPVVGEAVEFFDYLKGSMKQHLLGVLGGALWCAGAVAAFVAATGNADVPAQVAGAAAAALPVGPAMSYATGQGAALVAALWGLLWWKEFKEADAKVKSLAALLLVLFAAGLALVAMAPLQAAGK